MSELSTESTKPTRTTAAQETAACCCVDVGTIIDNTDCTASYQNVFATRADAEAALEDLTARARRAESDPCDINSQFNEVEGGVELTADFTFCCQIESINFQLALR
ncbi:YfcZ/YiiS family protein [Rouxiella badensis]|jgi:uncharacterized protein (TIGR00743 family)|uniref:DUF406 domain-containing protein n=1 Tax=Rouxiella badensis TaxID=1646377 RepID=A0A1X0WCN4_9GAMM|nr:YfcZ/YiiS family protein [Rouxiella badensis]MCC3703069.1 YfcZ/YiiS family protein [Rouxiella badensis]MCC3721190.1 YfcZ/YiiS family protein [Rouxiella badensis]MCC3730915.1 YfcZ/YiiS family protein [Rouxiella badensis]MCC3734588.1 YfcZ/YiiS family protein [Rouxiella badensis]MCC3742427.1 YfcZ/YiiS family protein [Rouxiella badensis]